MNEKSMKEILSVLIISFSLVSCASSKAVIDRSAAKKIIWPGPPEKPRISYLWSVSVVSAGSQEGIFRFVAGEKDDLADPKNSLRLLRPYGIFVDDKKVLYVSDPGAFRITIIDTTTGDTRNIPAAGDEEFRSPIGIVSHQGRIYVSDSETRKVYILDMQGNRLGELQGAFERPTALAVDAVRGIIYVTDTLAHAVIRYSPDGKRLDSIGGNGAGDGKFNFPTHLWVDGEGRLYVTDAMNFRIQIFSSDGLFEGKVGTLGDAYGNLEKPKGVATDSQGHLYVVDSIKDTVKIFSSQGQLLLFFGQQGRDFGQFWLPSGIFIDKDDTIYVADTYNGRIQAFEYIRGK